MNPTTDSGKRELSYNLRSRIVECFVHDLMDDDDLRILANKYLDGLHTAKGVTTEHCTWRTSPCSIYSCPRLRVVC
uniref:Uncharacterized protein n=1 Tax=Aegilops tauschii subsp. strangulata TaxID=200361 RepID=A0A452YF15_AEGTS